MANGDIAPPSEPLTVSGDGCRPSWYRYFVQRKHIEDGVTGSVVITFGDERSIYPNSKALTVATGELTETDNDTTLQLGLADTAVTPDTYGEPTRILVLAIDAKGRITDAQEIKLDVSDVDGVLVAENGGTGHDIYTVGDLLYASATDALSRLPDVATGNVLKSGGIGNAPSYGKVSLTADVSGTLPSANGGFPGGGFNGTGAYTTFTFVNGLCTVAS